MFVNCRFRSWDWFTRMISMVWWFLTVVWEHSTGPSYYYVLWVFLPCTGQQHSSVCLFQNRKITNVQYVANGFPVPLSGHVAANIIGFWRRWRWVNRSNNSNRYTLAASQGQIIPVGLLETNRSHRYFHPSASHPLSRIPRPPRLN